MNLLTKEIEKNLKPYCYYDGKDPRKVPIVVKYFTPDSSWTWYAWERIEGTNVLFGLVAGMEVELGTFDLDVLRQVRGKMGLPIERDLHFSGKTLYDLAVKYNIGWLLKKAS